MGKYSSTVYGWAPAHATFCNKSWGRLGVWLVLWYRYYGIVLTASPLTFSILGASKLNETFINKVWFPVWLKGTMRVETCKELIPQNQFMAILSADMEVSLWLHQDQRPSHVDSKYLQAQLMVNTGQMETSINSNHCN